MRQSEGNRTEKRPSAAWCSQTLAVPGGAPCETIGGPANALVAWPARIRSSLLLKTASSHIRGWNRGQYVPVQYSGDERR